MNLAQSPHRRMRNFRQQECGSTPEHVNNNKKKLKRKGLETEKIVEHSRKYNKGRCREFDTHKSYWKQVGNSE